MRTLAVLATLCAAAGLAFGQELVTDGGFEGTFVENPDLYADIGAETGVSTVSNVLWEWFGGAAWDLPADYASGQYGPSKAPRDFTSARFGGTVPAFQSNSWFVSPDGEELVGGGQEGADDHYITGGSNRWSWFIVDAPLAGSADQEGIRLKLSYDYIGDDDRTHMAVYGLNNNNAARKPFFGWDKDTDDNSLENEVLAGPDIVTIWQGNKTGQELLDLRDDQPESSTWASYSKSFFLAAPDAERGTVAFDQIALGWRAFADPGETSALDNVSLMWIHPGDANEDLAVDGSDAGVLVAKWGVGTEWSEADFIDDDIVDGSDAGALVANWTGDPGPAAAGTVIAEYNELTGEIVVSGEGIVNWLIESESGGLTGEAPAWGDIGGLKSDQDIKIGSFEFGGMTFTDVNLGAVAAAGVTDLVVNYQSGLGSDWEQGTLVVVPEPMTMSLLAIGGLAAIRRRRRS